MAKVLTHKLVAEGATIHLSRPVRKIRIASRGITVLLGDSTSVKADYAILAVPPPAWPVIEPALPMYYCPSMGPAIKYLSDMKSRFWLEQSLSSNSASNEYGYSWDGTDNQTQVPGQKIAFSLFAGGPTAQHVLDIYMEKGPSGLRDFYRTAIGKIYRDYASNLSSQPRFVAWPFESWTRAGYSSYAPGEVCRTGPLLQEAYQDRLYFAGEHTCLAFYGYMEGALQSGLATSWKILNSSD